MALVLLSLAASHAVLAQSRTADPELNDLIPDTAVADPQSWAKASGPAAVPAPAPAPVLDDPATPLADLPGLTLAWPDGELPVIEPLAPENPNGETALADSASPLELPVADPAALASAQIATPLIARPQVMPLGEVVELAVPADDEAFPEKQAVAARFASLSSLIALASREDTLAQIASRARVDRELLVNVLRNFGYYDPQVVRATGDEDLVAAPPAAAPAPTSVTERKRVRFEVLPGPRYALRSIALGDLERTGSDAQDLRSAFPLYEGDPVNADRVSIGRDSVIRALGETGYLFARVDQPDLVIDHAARMGDVSVPVTNGGRFVFGTVNSLDPKFLSSDHLSRIARFDPGDLARQSLVDDLRQAMLATGLVSAVTITPRSTRAPVPPSATAPDGVAGALDLDVAISRAPLRTVAGLLGYSTGQGASAEVSWEHRNLFPPEGALKLRAVAGTRQQLAGITFRRNNFRQRDQVLTGDLFISNIKYIAYTAKTVSLLATIQRQATLLFQKPFTYSAGVQVLATRDTNGSFTTGQSIPQTYFIAALPLEARYDGSDDLLNPTRGVRLGLEVSPELSTTRGQQYAYFKLRGEATAYRPFAGEKVVLAGRISVGSITGAPIIGIAPSRRFYAGGGGSVRGYGYQLIGPTDTAGNPAGGRSVTELSAEARIRTGLGGGAISVVPFIDAGAVDPGPTPTLRDIKIGAGLGLRYLTGFGPIRIDVGTPLKRGPNDSRIAVVVALGQAF